MSGRKAEMTMEDFELLTENVYVHRDKIKQAWDDVQECGCVPDETTGECCGDDSCANRATFIECHPEHCKGHDKCKNQRLLRREYAKVERFGVRDMQCVVAGATVFSHWAASCRLLAKAMACELPNTSKRAPWC